MFVLFFILVFTSHHVAFSADWKLIGVFGSGPNSVNEYVDNSSIEAQGIYRVAWTRSTPGVPLCSGNICIVDIMTQVKFTRTEFCYLEGVTLYNNGTNQRTKLACNWSTVSPGVHEARRNYLFSK